eukprot:gene3416-4397_t
MKPVEGVSSTGAPWHVAMRFGALPQVLSNFASYTLLRFEINVRGAAVMGFVGAGGIGQDLIEAIRKFYYSDVSAILVLILLTVAVIDSLTSILRKELMDAVRARYPEHFTRWSRQRLSMIGIAAALFVLLLFGMGELGFFGGTLLTGMGRLFEIAGLMMPPDPGSWAHARAYGMALIETVAIALLGTLAAAVLALPVGLLAARNVTAQRIVRFLARRSLDTIR